MPDPMNILVVFADQMHRYAMGCMGTADIHTPNLDRLASEGVLFRNAYSNCPVCTPFRISLLTGLYASQTSAFGNAERIPEDVPTFASTFNDAGYRTSYVGKWHIGATGGVAVPEELRGGFTDFIGYQCYNGFIGNVKFFDEQNNEHIFYGHRTDVTTDLAVERLQAIADGPFAMCVSYQAPHYPEQPSARFEEKYRGVEIQRRPNSQEIDPFTRTWSPPSAWPPDDCPDYRRYGNDLSEYLRLYYAMVTQVDAGVGRILDALDESGVADNTVVIFTSDHGDMQGSHGLKNKILPHEESSGIPFIVRVPRDARVPVGARGTVTDALVSGIDIFPTCLDYAGLPAIGSLPGSNFAPLTRGEPQELGGPVFSEFPGWKMVREGDLKLVTDDGEYTPTAFHDLAEDPYEMTNLVDDSAHAEAIKDLCERIAQWQQAAQVGPQEQ